MGNSMIFLSSIAAVNYKISRARGPLDRRSYLCTNLALYHTVRISGKVHGNAPRRGDLTNIHYIYDKDKSITTEDSLFCVHNSRVVASTIPAYPAILPGNTAQLLNKQIKRRSVLLTSGDIFLYIHKFINIKSFRPYSGMSY